MRYYALAVAACENWGIDLYNARFPTDPNRLIDQGTAFEGYLEGGLTETASGVELACPPSVEADVFAASAESGVYDRVSEIDVPVRLVISDDPGGLAEAMRLLPERFRNVTTSYLTGQSHMVVMEAPELVAAEIAAMLVPA